MSDRQDAESPRRRGSSPAASDSPLSDDDLLREILVRLSPQPSSLPRASAVCKRWRCIVGDSKFHHQFYAHHQKPPLLGVFENRYQGIVFIPVLDTPNRVSPDLGRCSGGGDYDLLDCRHGLVLVRDRLQNEVVVCDPITDEQRRASVPPEFKSGTDGAVLCAAGDLGHVHGGCHSRPFKVVLISVCSMYDQHIACVYSSQTGIWGNLIATEAFSCVLTGKPGVLVGDCLYWLSMENDILEFDLDESNLTVISGPPFANDTFFGNWQIIQAEDGAVGFVILCYPHLHIWQRKISDHGVATWVPRKTMEMHNILGLPPQIEGYKGETKILGYDEDTDEMFFYVNNSAYMVLLKLLQSRKIYESYYGNPLHSFKSFYTPGTSITGGCNGAEMLHDT